MSFSEITYRYYSSFFGDSELFSTIDRGLHFVRSTTCDRILDGYGKRLGVIAWVDENRTIIAYGESEQGSIDELQARLAPAYDADSVAREIAAVYGEKISRSVKFLYVAASHYDGAHLLGADEFDGYLAFFKAANPNCTNTSWVRDYFDDMLRDGVCCGVFNDGRLVSCTDAPTMPFMASEVQEIGINTLEDSRGRGFAASAASLAAKSIVGRGRCPMWSCTISNGASRRLAEKIGFVPIGEMISVAM